MSNTPKLEFLPGCFDSFEGTQEELDELMQSLQGMFESGDIPENVKVVYIDELEDDTSMIDPIFSNTRTLQ